MADKFYMSPSTKKAKTSSSHIKSVLEETIQLETHKCNPWYGNECDHSDRYFSILETRKGLPVHKEREEFLKMYHKNQVMVFVGETGSGKTTQIPQFIAMDELARGKTDTQIACTQPRRVAAMSVAERVSHEMDVKLGHHVGYSIRFDDKTSESTKLKYMTDGMLLREAMTDPELSKYSCIILDEAHERTMPTDILMGLLKLLIVKRPDLKIVVMSATLDAEKFQKYFNNAPLMSVSGRSFPVEVFYTPETVDDYLSTAVRTVLQIHSSEPQASGDVLLFLTGEEEIEEACNKISLEADQLYHERPEVGKLDVYPLYGSLPPQQQQQIFNKAPVGGRKVVVGTNIAETSLTIDGIVYVIDPGFSKQKVYNPRARVESLLVSPISKASAAQRAGRAGRTRPGKCFRLYPKQAYEKELSEQTPPEILRTSLANTILELLKLGFTDLVHFDFIDPPAPETMMRALEELNCIGCLDNNGDITQLGEQCSLLPLEPVQAVSLLSSCKLKCAEEMLSIIAMLSVPPVFVRPHNSRREADQAKANFEDPESDHLTMLNIYNQFIEQSKRGDSNLKNWVWENYLNLRTLQSARSVRNQLRDMLLRQGFKIESSLNKGRGKFNDRIRQALISGYFIQTARSVAKKVLKTVKDNQEVLVHPSSGVKRIEGQYLLYHEFVLTTSNYIRTVTIVKPEQLYEVAPQYFDPKNFHVGSSDVAMTFAQVEKKTSKK